MSTLSSVPVDAGTRGDGRHRTLIVANRTASTPVLLQEVDRRAAERPTHFTLLIPDAPSKKAADWTLGEALKALRKAAAGIHGLREAHVDGRVGGTDAFESVKSLLAVERFDDVIVSTLESRVSEWLRRDLPRRIEELGVPVAVITPPAGGFSLFAKGPGSHESGR